MEWGGGQCLPSTLTAKYSCFLTPSLRRTVTKSVCYREGGMFCVLSERKLKKLSFSARAKEKKCCEIYHYYLLPKSDPNLVYLLPNAVYWLQCSFATANIAWAGQYNNNLWSTLVWTTPLLTIHVWTIHD